MITSRLRPRHRRNQARKWKMRRRVRIVFLLFSLQFATRKFFHYLPCERKLKEPRPRLCVLSSISTLCVLVMSRVLPLLRPVQHGPGRAAAVPCGVCEQGAEPAPTCPCKGKVPLRYLLQPHYALVSLDHTTLTPSTCPPLSPSGPVYEVFIYTAVCYSKASL